MGSWHLIVVVLYNRTVFLASSALGASAESVVSLCSVDLVHSHPAEGDCYARRVVERQQGRS